MRKSILVVIAVVVSFLALIVGYTMTPPDALGPGDTSPPQIKH